MNKEAKKIVLFGLLSLAMLLMVFTPLMPLVLADDDAGSGGDAGNTFDTALLITSGTYTGSLSGSTDDVDFYKFSINESQILNITMTPDESADFELRLYSAQGDLTAYSTSYGASPGKTERLFYAATSTGDWRVKVEVGSTIRYASGDYILRVSIVNQNDGNSGDDAGNYFDAATVITAGNYSGMILDGDTVDFYKVEVNRGQTLDIRMSPGSKDFDLRLHDPEGTLRATSHKDEGISETIQYEARTAGYWRIEIYDASIFGATGNYTLRVNISGQEQNTTATTITVPGSPTPSSGSLAGLLILIVLASAGAIGILIIVLIVMRPKSPKPIYQPSYSQSRYCPVCGASNSVGSVFCINCGNRL